MDVKDLGMRVKCLRRSLGLTQEALAEMAGISPSFLGHIERGSRVASVDTLVSLCNALKVSPQYLLQASLEDAGYQMPQGLSSGERAALSRFLHLAEEVVRDLKD